MSGKVTVDQGYCKGCALCVSFCPRGLMALNTNIRNEKGYNPAENIDAGGCTGCAMCAVMCPESAITVERE